MVEDLKVDSVNFERSGDSGNYENSMVHRSRQHWGPSSEPDNFLPHAYGRREETDYTYNSLPRVGGAAPPYHGSSAPVTSNMRPGTAGTEYTYSSAPTTYGLRQTNQGSAHSGGVSQYSQPSNSAYSSSNAPHAQPPPGYYLASDGKFYPLAKKPN